MNLHRSVATELAEILAGTRERWSARLVYRARVSIERDYEFTVVQLLDHMVGADAQRPTIKAIIDLRERCRALRGTVEPRHIDIIDPRPRFEAP